MAAAPHDDDLTVPAVWDLPDLGDLELGVATSSWQIEGDLAGRGRCIWDDFAEKPGAVIDGAIAEPACDHVHRLEEDLDLLSWLGVDAYRFSISWPRLQPGGSGPVSTTGLDFYNRLVDGLLERGIRPVATLYHWDLPSELDALGGWLERSTAQRFAEYAHLAATHLADRVGGWATLNEPWVSAYLGYAAGIHAPGLRDPEGSLRAAYHLMLAHGQAMLSLREADARECGIVLNCQPIWADDDAPETAAAVRHIDGLHNRFFLDLLAGRGVPDDLRESCAPFADFSFVRDSDLPSIATPLDWIGENYYTVARVTTTRSSDERSVGAELSAYPGTPPCTFAPRPPLTQMGWEIVPEGLTEILGRITHALPGVPIWVTENMAFALKIQKVSKDDIDRRVKEAATLLDLTEYLDRKPKALSGGQRQRVAMGRAIVREPEVFLMDEPLSNLDAKLRVSTRTQIAALQKRLGTTTIYVTHDQVEAMTMGDRVAVLSAGVLQQVASPRELYESPANAFVGAFIGSPSMNLIETPIVDGGVRLGDYTVPIERDVLAKAGDAKTVFLGIRPEDLHIADEGAEMKVNLVEELGADAYVYGDTPEFDGTSVSLIAREPGSIGTRIGDTVRVRPNRTYVFASTGDRERLSA